MGSYIQPNTSYTLTFDLDPAVINSAHIDLYAASAVTAIEYSGFAFHSVSPVTINFTTLLDIGDEGLRIRASTNITRAFIIE